MFLINGKSGSSISVEDRGLHYGDGVFTTMAVENGGPPLCLFRHIARLQHDCDSLELPVPDISTLHDEINTVSKKINKGVVKIILTRGSGERGYRFPKPTNTTRIIADYPWPVYPSTHVTDGIKLFICNRMMGINPELAGIKHLNRMEQILARNEWDNNDYAEGLVININGHVIEGTMSNLFIIRGNGLITPDLKNGGIEGIIRNLIIEKSRDFNMEAQIQNISLDDVLKADEVFVCNSIIGVWPVREIGNRTYSDRQRTEKIRSFLLSNNFITE